jgi:hypothetical protein
VRDEKVSRQKPFLACCATTPRFTTWVLLHPRGLAPRIINLDEWAWHIIDRL